MTTTTTRRPTLAATIDGVLNSLGARRAKSAAANTEPGGYGTTTSHPSKDVDDGTRPASQGTRGDEIDKDLKAQEAIGSHSPPPVKSQDALQPNMGVKQTNPQDEAGTSQRESGDVPPDGGTYYGTTEHPARTDNEEIEKKYAAASSQVRGLLSAIQRSEQLGRSLAPALAKQAKAMISGEVTTPKAAAPAPAAPAAHPAPVAGPTEEEKRAFDNAAVVTIAEVVKMAHDNAVKLAASLRKRAELAPKAPEEEESKEEPDGDEQAPAHDEELALAGGAPGGGGAPGPGGNDPLASILAAAQATPSPEGAAPPIEDHGMPPEGGDGMPPEGGGMPPEGVAGMPSEEEMAMMQDALAQEGVTPEMLQSSLAGKVAALVTRVTSATKQASAGTPPTRFKPKTAKQAKQLEEWRTLIRELVQS